MQRILFLLALANPALAFAQDATADVSAQSQYASFIPLALIFGIFYFALIRPQQKKLKEHQAMIGELKKGDEIVTGGGIHGKITKIDADMKTVLVEIAKGVEVRVHKATVSTLVSQNGVPVPAPEKKKSANKNDNTVVSRENIANDN